ncbi:aminotransferase class III-fold pyridoxal phosphate-dependent enzyme [Rhodococcus sp. Eu-32]|uniref:aminotransferase class III-fold pyridoxal phosphate-dependent enzyme n=1 Tax=Rhodococcus sp. Eu-32 TaxID=1017319 RepID=UPI001FB4A29F|nr:aminotransferase class III-fold pyridoxal phosphate-dependent enzyme [Rhodococcus sp. Eu-32]
MSNSSRLFGVSHLAELPELVRGTFREAIRIIVWTTVFALRYYTRPKRLRSDEFMAGLLRGFLLRMGPLYMKAGQVLGTQSGLLSKDATDRFRSFFADLPPMSTPELREVLDEHFGRPVTAVFAEFDWAPIAVGSVAQVHKARLATGQDVAIKVVKAGVDLRLRTSAWVIGRLAAIAHRASTRARSYDLPGHFAELRPLLTGQTDMVAEAARQNELAENFRSHPHLRVPATVDHLTGRKVLVMEFVHATPGPDFETVKFPRPEIARRLQDAFYAMSYFHGFFHVDPHPGNLMFTDEGKIIALDFGLVGRLDENDKWNLASFYYACVKGQWELAVERCTRAFVADPSLLDDHRAEYDAKLEVVLRRHFEETSARWSTMSFFDDATRLLREYNARVSTRFSLLALAFLTGEGFISQIDPDIDIWANGRTFTDRFSPYMSEEVAEQFDREIGDRIPKSMAEKRDPDRRLIAPTHLDRFALPSAFPLLVKSAQGSVLSDVDGNDYIDLSCGYGPHILGYAHPVQTAAIAEAATAGSINALGNEPEIALARQLSDAFGSDNRVILSNSGTEAVQMAVRLARAYTGKQRVAKFEGHYHGFSDQGLVSSWFRYSGSADRPEPTGTAGMAASTVSETVVLQYGERGSIDRLVESASDIACVLVEPMPTAMASYDRAFLEDLRRACDTHRIVLIFDEVVTGFRVAYGGVQTLAGIRPHLTCLGKIIGGGLPCGAVVGDVDVVSMAKTTEDPFVDIERQAFLGGTMSGNSITAAAGSATLAYLDENREIYDDLERRTDWLTDELRDRAAGLSVPLSVRGFRSIFSLTFDYAKPKRVRDRLAGSNIKANIALAYYMRRHGVYMPELHTMLLSAAHSDTDMKVVAEAFGNSVSDMSAAGFFAT